MKKRVVYIGIGVLFVISLVMLIMFRTSNNTANTAKIYCNGELAAEIDLDVTQSKEIHLSGNTILIENGRVCMTEADCPDKLCVKQGWISDSSMPIVCLPNKVVIELSEKSKAADIAAR